MQVPSPQPWALLASVNHTIQPEVLACWPHRLGALQVPGQVHEQVMGNGVYQIEEGHIPVEDIREEDPLEAQVLWVVKRVE